MVSSKRYQRIYREGKVKAMQENRLFVSCNCSEKDYPHPYTTDVFAFSTSRIMDIYSDTFNLYENGVNADLLGERALHRQLSENEVSAKWCPIRFKLLRKWTTEEVYMIKSDFVNR